MDINLDDLYFPTEEEIKESISLTSNEESEEPYYLPTVEEAEQAEIIFSFGENKEENYESDENPYLPTKEEKEPNYFFIWRLLRKFSYTIEEGIYLSGRVQRKYCRMST